MGSHRTGSTVVRIHVGPLYNLLSRMYMSSEYMFLTMVILGPSNPKCLINVYMELIELQNLWHVGVLTRDSANNEIFTMHATLMWIVNDLPSYGIASGWSTVGVMGVQIV
ncbi:UNVERIFIED_CONTAM: hypothetical protein Slati_3685100 [Sesamum latifolium]|uniref:Uncharacterized protein n=1 Tax=Sesamum latifolium TaxID=2727402 RepID=A0AAW2U285_9LAMI